MDLQLDVFDMWTFVRAPEPRYLLLHTSQKADRWFGGGRFWQIPGEFLGDAEDIVDGLRRCCRDIGVEPAALWTVEHCYPIYNRRFNRMQLIPVFAAELETPVDPVLTWEHSEAGWFTAEECRARVSFRGLLEGLEWLREYVAEPAEPRPEFRLV